VALVKIHRAKNKFTLFKKKTLNGLKMAKRVHRNTDNILNHGFSERRKKIEIESRENFSHEWNFNEIFLYTFTAYSTWILSLLSLLPAASMASSASEKWSWPTSPKQEPQRADSRRDIYYENVNGGEKSGRIRVPTSYYDNNRR
jgi:hypothetical protein